MREFCPICGGKLGEEIWMQNPPNRGKKCKQCGRLEEVPREEMKQHPRVNNVGKVYPFV